jgi:hypothetical protein
MKSNRSLLASTLHMRRTQQLLCWLALIGATLLYLPSKVVFAGPIAPTLDQSGNVTWGPPPLIDPTVNTIEDMIPGQGTPKPPAIRNGSKPDSVSGTIEFYWSDGDVPDPNHPGKRIPHKHPGYDAYTETNNGNDYKKRFFMPPLDDTIKDWHQTITIKWSDDTTSTSKVEGGTIQHNRVKEESRNKEESRVVNTNNHWGFFSLDQLPKIGYKIPDLAPTGDDLTIYTAVDLLQYETHNPLGFLGGDYQIGQTIDQLGIKVVNGQISGLEGIYFSTTPFLFDPNSATGYVPDGGSSGWLNSADFESANGTIYINGIHNATSPEPSSVALLGIGTIFLLRHINRRRKQAPA